MNDVVYTAIDSSADHISTSFPACERNLGFHRCNLDVTLSIRGWKCIGLVAFSGASKYVSVEEASGTWNNAETTFLSWGQVTLEN